MKISVYVTSYNQKEVLREAVDSVLAQTAPLHQVIIVDDASSDGSQDLIQQYASDHPDLVSPIFHEQNQGVTQSRLDALDAVTGDYVTYVDGDDRLLPTKIEKEARALRTASDAKIAFSNNHYVSTDGSNRLWTWIEGSQSPPTGAIFAETFGRLFPRRSLFRMEMVDFHAWKRIGFHDPSIDLYEDYDVRIRMTKHLRATYVDEPLSEVRVNETGLSSSPRAQHLDALEYIYQKNRPLLDDLSAEERHRVVDALEGWLARISLQAAREACGAVPNPSEQAMAGRAQARRYFWKALRYDTSAFDARLAARLLLPDRLLDAARMLRP